MILILVQVHDDSNDENMTEDERASKALKEAKRRKVDTVKFRYLTAPAFVNCGIQTVDIQLEGQFIRKIWTS